MKIFNKLNPEDKSLILYDAIDLMQEYNGRSREDCIALAMGYEKDSSGEWKKKTFEIDDKLKYAPNGEMCTISKVLENGFYIVDFDPDMRLKVSGDDLFELEKNNYSKLKRAINVMYDAILSVSEQKRMEIKDLHFFDRIVEEFKDLIDVQAPKFGTQVQEDKEGFPQIWYSLGEIEDGCLRVAKAIDEKGSPICSDFLRKWKCR